ncbi:hypothetical protein MKZ38_007953 [Zalerion maritima]|uniref:Uncharacterized protein n=1 Tax=Zalerion maritima TaxID=339359 RepID=A0AAD5RI95_9PEZI|nr:hypothetical protein MKZ38_007953 [Zalerion maritima]
MALRWIHQLRPEISTPELQSPLICTIIPETKDKGGLRDATFDVLHSKYAKVGDKADSGIQITNTNDSSTKDNNGKKSGGILTSRFGHPKFTFDSDSEEGVGTSKDTDREADENEGEMTGKTVTILVKAVEDPVESDEPNAVAMLAVIGTAVTTSSKVVYLNEIDVGYTAIMAKHAPTSTGDFPQDRGDNPFLNALPWNSAVTFSGYAGSTSTGTTGWHSTESCDEDYREETMGSTRRSWNTSSSTVWGTGASTGIDTSYSTISIPLSTGKGKSSAYIPMGTGYSDGDDCDEGEEYQAYSSIEQRTPPVSILLPLPPHSQTQFPPRKTKTVTLKKVSSAQRKEIPGMIPACWEPTSSAAILPPPRVPSQAAPLDEAAWLPGGRAVSRILPGRRERRRRALRYYWRGRKPEMWRRGRGGASWEVSGSTGDAVAPLEYLPAGEEEEEDGVLAIRDSAGEVVGGAKGSMKV